MPGPERLATVAQAAERLGLSEARVHQLIKAGELDGPALPPGRLRHVPGTGRVTETSLDSLIVRRTDLDPPRTGSDPTHETVRPSVPSSNAARAAAQELKVQLDTARDALRAERDRSRRLLDVTAELVELLRGAADAADGVDRLADGYSAALTQLLSPDDGSDITH